MATKLCGFFSQYLGVLVDSFFSCLLTACIIQEYDPFTAFFVSRMKTKEAFTCRNYLLVLF